MGYQHVKDTIEQAGYFFGDAGVRWGNYQIYPDNDWIAGWEYEFNYPSKPKVAYDELLEQSKIDKRVTLRLPPSLHNYIAYSAAALNTSANQLIIDILASWQQERMREQVYHLKLDVRYEVGLFVKCLEEAIRSDSLQDIERHRQAVRASYDAYDQTCRSLGIQDDPDVFAGIPASARP
jgi:predicted HicB family RNase H-like nuclease